MAQRHSNWPPSQVDVPIVTLNWSSWKRVNCQFKGKEGTYNQSNGLPGCSNIHGMHPDTLPFRVRKWPKFPRTEGYNPRFLTNFWDNGSRCRKISRLMWMHPMVILWCLEPYLINILSVEVPFVALGLIVKIMLWTNILAVQRQIRRFQPLKWTPRVLWSVWEQTRHIFYPGPK